MVLLPLKTAFGSRVRGSRAAAGRLAWKAGLWNPRRPLSELRRRCDTNTNFHYNHYQ